MVFPVAGLVTEMDSPVGLRIDTFLFLFARGASLVWCRLRFVVGNTEGGRSTDSRRR